jgi:hypothetical protein
VFTLSGGDRAEIVVGLDRVCRPWGAGEEAIERSLYTTGCPPPAAELVDRVAALGYEFIVLDPSLSRMLETRCSQPDAYRRLALALSAMPGVELVASVPQPQVPSATRWALFRIEAGSRATR